MSVLHQVESLKFKVESWLRELSQNESNESATWFILGRSILQRKHSTSLAKTDFLTFNFYNLKLIDIKL
jgi:hypothetical protein